MRRMTAAWCSRCLWCDGHADHTAIGGDGIHHPPPAAGETCKTCDCERPPADMTDPGEVRHPLAITRDGTRYLLVTTSADSEQLHDGRPSIHVTASYVAADRMTDRDRLAHEALAAGTEHHIAAATADVLDAMHRLAAAVAATADRHGLRSTAGLLGISHETARRWSTPDGITGSAQLRSVLATIERSGAAADDAA